MKIKYTLKYGQKGLFLRVWSGKNYTNKNDIMVSKNYPKIFEFLGLDYDKWVEGFDTLEEIFEYVMTSSLFNPEMFQLKHLNKVNRERNIKRTSYMSFLEFIKNKAPHPDYNKNKVALAKENVIDMIREGFPEANIDVHLAEINYKHAERNLIKSKFNGKILMDKYGLEGKMIGEFIKGFKNYIESDSCIKFDYFILIHDYDHIYNIFDKFVKEEFYDKL